MPISLAAMTGPVTEDFMIGSLVAAVFIVFAIVGGAVAIAWMVIRHKERMAAIGMGLDPGKASQTPASVGDSQRYVSPTR